MNVECSADYQCMYITGYVANGAGPVYIGAVIVKRTWERVSDTQTEPAAEQEKISLKDELYTPAGSEERVLAESDLALVKERADLVVLDDDAGDFPGSRYTVTRSANREQATSLPVRANSREIIGWSPRQEPADVTPPTRPRRVWGGTGDLESFDPFTERLPEGFSNFFFNGMVAAPASAAATDITVDTLAGVGAGDLLRIQGVGHGMVEFHVVDGVLPATGQILLVTPLLQDYPVGTSVSRMEANTGSTLTVDTSRTMNVGGNLLAVSDAIALTLDAGQVIRIRDLTDQTRTQYVIVQGDGSRTIRGTFRFTFDVDNIELRSVNPAPVGGDPARSVTYALPFTYFEPAEKLTLTPISAGGAPSLSWTLPDSGPAATLVFRDAMGVTQSQAVNLNFDTVLFRRPANSFTTVWRGRWDMNDPAGTGAIPIENYVALRVA